MQKDKSTMDFFVRGGGGGSFFKLFKLTVMKQKPVQDYFCIFNYFLHLNSIFSLICFKIVYNGGFNNMYILSLFQVYILYFKITQLIVTDVRPPLPYLDFVLPVPMSEDSV